jgi:putative acetyltransferase
MSRYLLSLQVQGESVVNPQIRLVQPRDNEALSEIVIAVLTEFGCVGPGFASSDPEIMDMYGTYQAEGTRYWVIEDLDTGEILGGGGFSRLKGTAVEEGICELQKLYFRPQARGLGLGKHILALAIEHATVAGYREMYLESVPAMEKAIGLYQKFGFIRLEGPKGCTGHHACSFFMTRQLDDSALSSGDSDVMFAVLDSTAQCS